MAAATASRKRFCFQRTPLDPGIRHFRGTRKRKRAEARLSAVAIARSFGVSRGTKGIDKSHVSRLAEASFRSLDRSLVPLSATDEGSSFIVDPIGVNAPLAWESIAEDRSPKRSKGEETQRRPSSDDERRSGEERRRDFNIRRR